ncbi:MAG: ABC transporter permease subunit [Chloroflexota bacterium]
MTSHSSPTRSTRVSPFAFLRDERFLQVLSQIIFFLIIGVIAYWFTQNMLAALARQGMQLGYGFLTETAGFDIGEKMIEYSGENNFARALQVGLLNTLLVCVWGLFFATIIGLVVGVARLSTNFIVSRIAWVFIELMRNIPLLVLLVFLHGGIFLQLPRVREAIAIPGSIYLSNRGLTIPWFTLTPAFSIQVPELQGFNFSGGLTLSPEFSALLIGLSIYTGGFIAEIVRAGIQAISKGQTEAARALGFSWWQTLRLIILPQAMRVIIPPLTSQYLNLTKNSSLAVAIGYPDLLSISNTISNQTGRSIEMITIIMAIYLSLSLITSAILNWYNNKVRLVER